MMWKKMLVIFSSLLVCTSCDRGKDVKRPEKILRMNITREPTSMDPRRGNDLTCSILHFTLFEGLTRINPDGTMALGQAESIEISDDRKTYTFHLRDTKWSDGTKITAYDFEKSWKTSISPSFPAFNGQLFYVIKNAEPVKRGDMPLEAVGIRAIDDKTLVVELENPTPYFLELCAFANFLPINHRIDQQNPDWAFNASPSFTTNGPFKLAEWKHNNELVFEKNPFYWEQEQILLDKIHVSMVADEHTVLNMFENGEVDLLGHGVTNIPTSAIKKYDATPLFHTSPCPGSTFVAFNTTKPPFSNKNIRKAFALAINRKEIIENISQMQEDVATSLIPPMLTGGLQTKHHADHDVATAQALFQKGLEELGISAKEFPPIVYSYSAPSGCPQISQALQNQWEKAFGIRVALQSCEHKVLLDKLSRREYDLSQALYIAFYRDPLAILERFKYKENLKNYPGWQHPEFVRLLNQSATEISEMERIKILQAAEAIIMDEMPLTALYHWKSAFLIKPHILNTEEINYGAFTNFARLNSE